MWELLGVSALSGNIVKVNHNFAIYKHHFFFNQWSGFDNSSILASNYNDLEWYFREELRFGNLFLKTCLY